mmetsp:Transcript_41149/g.60511  ORF Transcript_41149/g.60511 Transcript_41149/m.60511 type:complete len:221 (-) Transcript_41149:761-1423(-)
MPPCSATGSIAGYRATKRSPPKLYMSEAKVHPWKSGARSSGAIVSMPSNPRGPSVRVCQIVARASRFRDTSKSAKIACCVPTPTLAPEAPKRCFMKTFLGLMSQWITPARCMCSMARKMSWTAACTSGYTGAVHSHASMSHSYSGNSTYATAAFSTRKRFTEIIFGWWSLDKTTNSCRNVFKLSSRFRLYFFSATLVPSKEARSTSCRESGVRESGLMSE